MLGFNRTGLPLLRAAMTNNRAELVAAIERALDDQDYLESCSGLQRLRASLGERGAADDEFGKLRSRVMSLKRDSEAIYGLARQYAAGPEGAVHRKLAFRLLQPPASRGSADGQCELRKHLDPGQLNPAKSMNAEGQISSRDQSEALLWYLEAAAQGHAEAQVLVGNCYEGGHGTKADSIRAVSWYRKAAEQGHPEAQYHLWRLDRAHKKESFDLLCESAERGFVPAQFCLAKNYSDHGPHHGVKADSEAALYWYRKAAEQSVFWISREAKLILGGVYRPSTPPGHVWVKPSPAESLHWLHLAASQGDTRAMWPLYSRYRNGEGCRRDLVKATHWLKRLVQEEPDGEAQLQLGDCYARALGEEEDASKAFRLYEKAAHNFHHPGRHEVDEETSRANAKLRVARCYANGLDVTRDLAEAVFWYQQAAQMELREAQLELGDCYAEGHGVLQDFEKAAHWYRLAALQGDPVAKNKLDTILGN